MSHSIFEQPQSFAPEVPERGCTLAIATGIMICNGTPLSDAEVFANGAIELISGLLDLDFGATFQFALDGGKELFDVAADEAEELLMFAPGATESFYQIARKASA